jgi:hypothetical protein
MVDQMRTLYVDPLTKIPGTLSAADRIQAEAEGIARLGDSFGFDQVHKHTEYVPFSFNQAASATGNVRDSLVRLYREIPGDYEQPVRGSRAPHLNLDFWFRKNEDEKTARKLSEKSVALAAMLRDNAAYSTTVLGNLTNETEERVRRMMQLANSFRSFPSDVSKNQSSVDRLADGLNRDKNSLYVPEEFRGYATEMGWDKLGQKIEQLLKAGQKVVLKFSPSHSNMSFVYEYQDPEREGSLKAKLAGFEHKPIGFALQDLWSATTLSSVSAVEIKIDSIDTYQKLMSSEFLANTKEDGHFVELKI